MKTKQLAVFFLYLFCFQYVLGAVAASYGPSPRKKRNAQCSLTPQLTVTLQSAFERVRGNLDDEYPIPDQSLNEYVLTQGSAVGFRNFQTGGFRCVCGPDFVRIFVRVDFQRILVTFVLNLVKDLLGGLLGGLGSALAQVLGNVVNLLVRILALRIIVKVKILQRFIPGTKCVLESFQIVSVVTIRLLGLDLAPVAEILSPLLAPVVNSVLHAIMNDRVKVVFQREIERLTIFRSDVIC